MSSARLASSPTRTSAHGKSIGSGIDDILRVLVQNLGKKTVATILKKDLRTVQRWLASKPATIGMEDERVLRDVHQIYSMIAESDDSHVARAWFLGMNPNLGDSSPVEALVEGRARAVVAAARSFVNAG